MMGKAEPSSFSLGGLLCRRRRLPFGDKWHVVCLSLLAPGKVRRDEQGSETYVSRWEFCTSYMDCTRSPWLARESHVVMFEYQQAVLCTNLMQTILAVTVYDPQNHSIRTIINSATKHIYNKDKCTRIPRLIKSYSCFSSPYVPHQPEFVPFS